MITYRWDIVNRQNPPGALFQRPGQILFKYSTSGKLDKKKSSIMESDNTINAFFEDPDKCGEGMLLLMQGLGLVPTLRTRTASRGGSVHRTASMSEDDA